MMFLIVLGMGIDMLWIVKLFVLEGIGLEFVLWVFFLFVILMVLVEFLFFWFEGGVVLDLVIGVWFLFWSRDFVGINGGICGCCWNFFVCCIVVVGIFWVILFWEFCFFEMRVGMGNDWVCWYDFVVFFCLYCFVLGR